LGATICGTVIAAEADGATSAGNEAMKSADSTNDTALRTRVGNMAVSFLVSGVPN
jgi:hypothetical protein